MQEHPRAQAVLSTSAVAPAQSGQDDPPIHRRIERLLAGGSLRVLGLFAGCGGMSVGLHRAGYLFVGNVALDPDAVRSHALNFRGGDAASLALHGKTRDISTNEPEDLAAELGLRPVAATQWT